jgi:tetratricopeptide (TPR) repeat protein
MKPEPIGCRRAAQAKKRTGASLGILCYNSHNFASGGIGMRRNYWAFVFLTATVTLFTLNPLAAQSTGGGGGGTGGGGTGGGTGGAGGAGGGTGGTTPPGGGGATRPPIVQPGGQQDQRQQFPEMVRPVFFSGKVIVDEGAPPPEPAVIELVCGGSQPRPQGYTDSKGRFSFQLGQNQAMFADASVSNNDTFGSFGNRQMVGGPMGGNRGITERDLMGCELRAALPGYVSSVVQLSGRRVLDNPDIGTIALKRLTGVEGFTFSMTTGNAPKDAIKAYEKGMDRAKKQKLSEAEIELRRAVEIYPKYAVAWNDLGRVLEAEKKVDEAKTCYEKSIEADPKFVNPHMQMMNLAGKAAQWDETLKRSETVLKLNPVNFPQAWFYNSVANLNLGNREAAEKSAKEALRLDPNHKIPKISHLLGVIMAQKQDYPSALEHFKGYLMAAPNAADAEQIRKQVTEMEKSMGQAAPRPPQE